MRKLFATTLLMLCTVQLPARTFTGKDGRTIDAEIVAKQGDQVRIRRADGQEFTIAVANLSPDDQGFIQNWQRAASPPPKPAAPPEPPKVSASELRKQTKLIEDVIYVVQQGDQTPVSHRWTEPPQLEVNSTDADLKKFMETSFADVCKETGMTLPPGTTQAAGGKIVVHIGPSKELEKVAKKEGADISLSAGRFCWTWWDEKKSHTEAVIYLYTDRHNGQTAKHLLLHDLLGVFGLPARSKEIDDCVVSEKSDEPTVLTPLDRNVLRFFYTHVPPNTDARALKKLIKEHWRP